MTRHGLAPSATACLERTRSAVLNVLVLDGIGVAISGLVLARRGVEASILRPEFGSRWFYLALLIVLLLGTFVRLSGGLGSRSDAPRRRASRFYWSHVASALIGLLALPLGFVYGWVVRPGLAGVGPFWAVTLMLGVLALPRAVEMEGFDSSMRRRPDDGRSDVARDDDGANR